MNARSKFAGFLLFSILLFSLAWTASPPPLVAQDVIVSQAIPDNAPQATLNLNVIIKGKGFKKGAIAKWFVTGTTNPGGVTVNSTAFVSSSELLANITIAPDAQTEKKFDIEVMLTNGRTGKGIELFSVTIPDPAIAYVSTSASINNVLMVMDADGRNKRVVLPGLSVMAYHPSWSPDGTQLVFGSDYQGNGIYVVNKDGTGLRKIIATNLHGVHPVLSPIPSVDGTWKIAFSDLVPGRQDNDLFLVNKDGTGLTNLTNSVGPGEFSPTWDPYATRLAAYVFPCQTCRYHDIIVFDLELKPDGSIGIKSTQNLTEAGPLHDGLAADPDWARTQDKIAVTGPGPGVWVIDLSEPYNPVNVAQATGGGYRPSWSPDDSRLLFQRKNAKNKDSIYTMNTDGTELTEIGYPQGEQQQFPDWRRCCPMCATVCAP